MALKFDLRTFLAGLAAQNQTADPFGGFSAGLRGSLLQRQLFDQQARQQAEDDLKQQLLMRQFGMQAQAAAREDQRLALEQQRFGLEQQRFNKPEAPQPEPIVAIQGPKGPVFVPRSEALGKSPAVKAPEPGLQFTPEEIGALGQFVMGGAPLPFSPGRGASGDVLRKGLADYIASAQKQGQNPLLNKASYKALTGALDQSQKNLAQVKTVVGNAERNARILERTFAGLPDTGILTLNQVTRELARTGGNPAVTDFNLALNVVRDEYAKILSGGSLISGQPASDAQREVLRSVISGNFTLGQLKGALAILRQDASNRIASVQDEINALHGDISTLTGTGNGGASSTPATPGLERFIRH